MGGSGGRPSWGPRRCREATTGAGAGSTTSSCLTKINRRRQGRLCVAPVEARRPRHQREPKHRAPRRAEVALGVAPVEARRPHATGSPNPERHRASPTPSHRRDSSVARKDAKPQSRKAAKLSRLCAFARPRPRRAEARRPYTTESPDPERHRAHPEPSPRLVCGAQRRKAAKPQSRKALPPLRLRATSPPPRRGETPPPPPRAQTPSATTPRHPPGRDARRAAPTPPPSSPGPCAQTSAATVWRRPRHRRPR